MSKTFPFLLAAVLAVSACSAPRTRPTSSAASAANPVATDVAQPLANDNLNAVAWTQTAIERDLIYRQTYHAAELQLTRALADPRWDALASDERKNALDATLKPAVILDIDETVLDNSPYQARLVANDASYNEFTWAEWCREENAKAVPGALEFTRLAVQNGVTVFYLSNRAQDLGDATVANLRKAGLPVAEDENVFLGLGTVVPGCEQNGSEKGCRRELIARRYRVLLQVGDQIGDFVDVLANTPKGRIQAVAPYLAWIGERWFVLPNPTYGSWEPALFNNDWSQPANERRRQKQAALRTD
ncbi:MAG TPA: HAD family acid phosphatase [Dokdonella sp.]|nr:HAD family acid phosphatase [Dokdonella sp.]